ncbi:MAG TPA: hypothetical protein PK990_03600 [Salinivirgaceae bacterium]|nr:hypothetical protein [Salinivirgaceae bacterium]
MSDKRENLLSKGDIEKIVSILKGIDEKIIELNNISAKDFLGFNEILKEYHQKTKELTAHSANLFDLFISLDETPLIQSSKSLQSLVNLRLASLKQISQQVDNTIKKTEEDLQQLFVPFNNFRQNLLSLKFLFTNVKLTQWISEPNHAMEINRLIDEISTYIQNTRDGLPALDNDIQFLSQQMTSLNHLVKKLHTQILPTLDLNSKELDKNLETINGLKNKAQDDSRRIEQLGQRCFKNLDSVITNIQYHDIIRQKMEHIQNTHQSIIENLMSSNPTTEVTNYQDYLKQIPEVVEIQAAQLMFTNKEYQNAIETINQKLYDTRNDHQQISEICKEKIKNIENLNQLFNKLLEQWTEIYHLFQEISTLAVQLTTTSAFYQDKIEDQVKKKHDLEEFENKLTQLLEKIKKIQTSERQNVDVFSKQIDPLLFDTKQSRIRMERLIPDSRHSSIRTQLLNLTETIALATVGLKSPPENSIVQIQNTLSSMRSIIEEIEKRRPTELLHSIEKVTYYDAFDREVEKIIASLNEIYIMLSPLNNTTKKSLDLLTGMEEHYTMQSQRDIHYGKNIEKNDEESDVELF